MSPCSARLFTFRLLEQAHFVTDGASMSYSYLVIICRYVKRTIRTSSDLKSLFGKEILYTTSPLIPKSLATTEATIAVAVMGSLCADRGKLDVWTSWNPAQPSFIANPEPD